MTTGMQQAIDEVLRLCVDPGDAVWVEDPGWLGTRRTAMAMGARLVPVPVDDDGLDVAAGIRKAPRARAVVATPSHHYPLGVSASHDQTLKVWDLASGRPLATLRCHTDGVKACAVTPDGRHVVSARHGAVAGAFRCGFRTLANAETGAWRTPNPAHGERRNRKRRSVIITSKLVFSEWDRIFKATPWGRPRMWLPAPWAPHHASV